MGVAESDPSAGKELVSEADSQHEMSVDLRRARIGRLFVLKAVGPAVLI